MPELGGDGRQVERGVGAAAGRRDRRDRVLERVPGDDVRRADVVVDERHHELARAPRRLVLLRVLGRDAVEAGGGQAEELEHRGHRVGRELAAAGARARAGALLDLVQLLERDLAGAVGADRLEDRDDVGRLALVGAGVDRAVVEDEARDVEPASAIAPAGIVLSQPTRHTIPSNRWPRATSSIESAMTSRLISEAFMPSVPIDTPSRHRDRVELHRRPARRADARLHGLRQPALVEVAGHRLDPRRRDAHDRLGEVVVGEADRLEHRPRAGPVGAVGERVAVALAGVGGAGVGQRVVGGHGVLGRGGGPLGCRQARPPRLRRSVPPRWSRSARPSRARRGSRPGPVTTAMNVGHSMAQPSTAATASTVAVRGVERSRPISPRPSPGPRRVRHVPSTETSRLPATPITYRVARIRPGSSRGRRRRSGPGASVP